MKSCTRCGSFLPLDQFQKRKASADGLTASCKPCLKEYDKRRYQENPAVKARHKKYLSTETGKKAAQKAKDKWATNNSIKRRAIQAVNNAVRDGRLAKSKHCGECGVAHHRIHGHHDDYALQLTVRWLCPKCHKRWHAEHGEAKNSF